MGENLRVVAITKSQLREAVDNNTYWDHTTIAPIPKSKAQWLLQNDRIEEHDYCAIFGFDGDTMVAFIFLFPDLMNMKSEPAKKIYWMLLWWVETKFQTTVLGTYMYNEALRLTKGQVLIKSYAEKVNDFYAKQPFDVMISRLRYTIFFGIDAHILKGRFPFIKYFGKTIKNLNQLVKSVVSKLNASKIKKKTKHIFYEYINELDQETWGFIEPLCKNDLIYKDKNYINWQINKKQYTEAPIMSKMSFHSLQAGYGVAMGIQNIKIFFDQKIIGFISYVRNMNECNIKYFLVEGEQYYDQCVASLMNHIHKEKLNFLFTDDSRLAAHIQKEYKTVFTYKKNKKGLAYKDVKIDKDQVQFFDRDGHFY